MRIKIGAKRIPPEKDSVRITILYRETLLAIEKGAELFQILEELELLPNKFRARLKIEPFEIDRWDELVSKMWLPVVWFNPDERREETTLPSMELYRSKAPKYWSCVWREGGERAQWHSNVGFDIDAPGLERVGGAKKIEHLFSALLSYGKADFARLQYYSAEENKSSAGGGEPETTLVSRTLVEECLPDLYNVTVWGEPYIKFFGREKLLRTPCHKAQELPGGLIWMQLGPHLYTREGCWTALKEVREKAKRHLDQRAFLDRELYRKDLAKMTASWDDAARLRWQTGEGQREYFRRTYNVPEFDLSEIRKPLQVSKEGKR